MPALNSMILEHGATIAKGNGIADTLNGGRKSRRTDVTGNVRRQFYGHIRQRVIAGVAVTETPAPNMAVPQKRTASGAIHSKANGIRYANYRHGGWAVIRITYMTILGSIAELAASVIAPALYRAIAD
jgi:hypothetical protein